MQNAFKRKASFVFQYNFIWILQPLLNQSDYNTLQFVCLFVNILLGFKLHWKTEKVIYMVTFSAFNTSKGRPQVPLHAYFRHKQAPE